MTLQSYGQKMSCNSTIFAVLFAIFAHKKKNDYGNIGT